MPPPRPPMKAEFASVVEAVNCAVEIQGALKTENAKAKCASFTQIIRETPKLKTRWQSELNSNSKAKAGLGINGRARCWPAERRQLRKLLSTKGSAHAPSDDRCGWRSRRQGRRNH